MDLIVKEYKNYKALCEENGETIKTGKSKQLHMFEIERLYDIEKVGNKIIVRGEKDRPIDKIDNRINNGGVSKYASYVDQLLIKSLIKNNNHIVGSMNDILTDFIPLLTYEWINLKQQGAKIVASKYKVAEFSVNQYEMQVASTLRNMINGSLNRLQKMGVVQWKKDFMLLSNSVGKVLVNDYENGMYDTIMDIEEEILASQGVSRKDIRFNQDTRLKFYDDTQSELQAITGGDAWGYYGVYNIGLVGEPDWEYVDLDVALKKLTTELILSIHKSLSNKHRDVDGKDFYPWLTYKLAKFVVIFEHEIFTHSDGKILDGDVVTFSNIKIEHIFKVKKERKLIEKEYEYLPY